jgi:hypothetical protein
MTESQKFQTESFRSFEIGVWNLFGICDLEFDIWIEEYLLLEMFWGRNERWYSV